MIDLLRRFRSLARRYRSLWPVSLPFVGAAALKLYILPLARMPFDSDEAIFLLMSRHILAGERPIFFYGEAYGGSSDSYLMAVFYYLFGDTIVVARLVQSLEYLAGMGFTYLLARRLLPGARLGPLAVLWLMAIPPLLMSTWTTPAVEYAIVIFLGSAISYLGYRLLREDADRPERWLLFGLVCGLAFWTFGILVVYMLPVFILFLWQFRRRRWPKYVLSAVAFFLASAPWWTQAVSGVLVVYNPERPPAIPPFSYRLLAFLTLTLPGFFGIREPWAPGLIWPVLAAIIFIFYLAALLYAILRLRRVDNRAPAIEPVGFALLGLQTLVWLILYFGTRFSLDATGRYILPLYPVLFIAAALLLERLDRWRRPLAVGLLAGLVAFNLAAHLRAVQTVPPGITAQMNPVLWFGNDSDQALIEFVAAQGGRGYSHHWISYKIAYLSNERVILASYLPYRPDLQWNWLDDRYPPYAAAVTGDPRPVYVTHRERNLEEYLHHAFAKRDITYQIKDIGPYRVYYDFSTTIRPQQIGLGPAKTTPRAER